MLHNFWSVIDQEQMHRVLTHTIRNPIVRMRNRAGLLRKLTHKNEALRGQFPAIADNCDYLLDSLNLGQNVVNGMLDTFSAGGKLDDILNDAGRGRTNLQTLLEKLQREMEWLSKVISEPIKVIKRAVHWSFPEFSGSAFVRGQEKAIELALRNLLDNAYKYTFPDRTVEVTLRRVNGAWHLSVKNSGVPIAMDERAKVLQKGYRGRAVIKRGIKAEEGTGYGLYLVRKIVEAGGGTVSVDSKVTGAEGETTVTIEFASIEQD